MDDLISRQAAIDAVNQYISQFDAIDVNFLDGLKETINIVKKLPSAQERIDAAYKEGYCDCEQEWLKERRQERKKGKWIYLKGLFTFECSVCGGQMVRSVFHYCPWCGAEMRG